ncbi:MAG: PAS domain S-box protein [Deltaproteobacteria bacterium]|nr:PAS domain S-box protein [Deltaproteobacteria bacterium]
MAHIHTRSLSHSTPSADPHDHGDRTATHRLMLIFGILSLGIVLGGAFYYRNYERHFRFEIEHQLSAIADLKVNELVQWRRERLADAGILYQNASFTALVQRFFKKPEDADAYRQIEIWLDKYRTHYQYDRAFLLDAKGDERLTVPGRPEAVAAHLAGDAARCLESGQVTFLDFHRDFPDGPVHLSLLVPIQDEPGTIRPIGVLVLRIDPGIYLYPLISNWPTPSRTAETMLVRRDGNDVLFLNERRFLSNTILNLRRSLDNTDVLAVKAVLGQQGVVEGLDYRGVPVIGALRVVPDSPWFLVTRMDTSEVVAPLRERLWLTVLFAGVLFLGSCASLGMLWRQQRVHYYQYRCVIERERAWLQDVIARSLNEIYVFDPRTLRFRFANTGACRNIGYSMAELGSLTPLDLKPDITEDAFRGMLQPLVTGERETLVFETTHRRKDGSEYPAEVHLQLVRNNDSGVFLAVINDITERRQAEEMLRKNERELRERNDELTRFTYTVSHDLKSPLVTIQTFLGYLEQDMRKMDTKLADRDMSYIRNAADKMGQLLNELLRLSRVGRVVNPSIRSPLQSIIHEALDLVAGQIVQKGVNVVVTTEPVFVTGDLPRLVEVFQNLVDNAVKFMGEQPSPRVDIGVTTADGERVLFVRDNGIGIDPRHQHKLFGLFEKLTPGSNGCGMGLALVKRIVEIHGGRIWVESEGVGQGSCFWFTLPGCG